MDKHINILIQLYKYYWNKEIKKYNTMKVFDEYEKQIRAKTWIYRDLKD